MPRKPFSALEAAAWAALAFAAKLNLKKVDIKRGAYRIDLRVTGTVSNVPVDFPVAGDSMQSGPQTTASSEGPSKEEIWTYAKQFMPASRLAEIEAEAIAFFTVHGRLPGVDEDAVKAAKPFLKKCRASSSETKAGAYTFCPDPDPEDLASAISRDAA